MKKFALFAMLLCASVLSFGCAEKKVEPKKDATTTEQKEGGEKAPETTPEQPK